MSLNHSGEFTNAAEFELLWIQKEVKDNYMALESLNDDDYIDYYLWQDINWQQMYEKHKPGVNIFRGKNPNIIFHDGCLGCKSQRMHGFERCKGCSFFRYKEGNINLHIPGEDSAKLSADDFTKLLGG